MEPFNDYLLSDVLHEKWEKIKKDIDKISNDEIMSNDIDILVDNYYENNFIELVHIYDEDEEKRIIQQGKIKKYLDPFRYNVRNGTYRDVDGIIISFFYPYTGDEVLFQCRASTFLLSPYPEIDIDSQWISLTIKLEAGTPFNSNEIKKSFDEKINDIRSGIRYCNDDAIKFNQSLKEKIREQLKSKKDKVSSFFEAAKALEIPVERNAFTAKHIGVKRIVLPVARHYDNESYYDITDEVYEDILDVIKHTLSTYERTPKSYESLDEEALRDTLLASLNGLYQGKATGETFRNNGKTDICIEENNRAAFLAECKIWNGAGKVADAINQLDSYTTWRDCKIALIYFVRKKNFMKILEMVKPTLSKIENIRAIKPLDKNEFECKLLSKQTLGQQLRLRIMFFNLYSGNNAKK